MNGFCVSSNPCKIPRCDLFLDCVLDDKNCNDNNPCTTDTCVTGVCKNSAHSLCNDNLKCTDDLCRPDKDPSGKNSTTLFVCDYIYDRTNCGKMHTCQEPACNKTADCTLTNHDDRCPVHPQGIKCLVPQCTNAGCGYRDICDISNAECKGCPSCSCNVAQNKCVNSCPAKRSVGLEEEENGGFMVPYSLVMLILCLIFFHLW